MPDYTLYQTEAGFGLQLQVPPAVEPVALADMRNYLRVDNTNDDQQISALITAARMMCEKWTGLALITQTWLWTKAWFPTYEEGIAIRLPKPPLQYVAQIQYTDYTATVQTVPPTVYLVDPTAMPGRVEPVYGKIWPIARVQSGCVQVTYGAGFGNAGSNVPNDLVQAIMLQVSDWYTRRTPPGELSGAVEAIFRLNWCGMHYAGFC
jgi:uncharacterized phiE125 gp8 family phage protein